MRQDAVFLVLAGAALGWIWAGGWQSTILQSTINTIGSAWSWLVVFGLFSFIFIFRFWRKVCHSSEKGLVGTYVAVQLYVERDGARCGFGAYWADFTSGFCGGRRVFIRSHSERFGIE